MKDIKCNCRINELIDIIEGIIILILFGIPWILGICYIVNKF